MSVAPTLLEDDRRPVDRHSGRAIDRAEKVAISMPANEPDAEQSVLGCMVLSPEAAQTAIAELKSTDFYDGRNQVLFVAVSEMLQAGQPCDAVTLSEHLRRTETLLEIAPTKEEAYGYLHRIIETVPHAAHVAYYTQIVRDRSCRRQIKERYLSAAQTADDPSVEIETLITRPDFSDLRAAQSGFEWLTAADLDAREFRQEYLIPGILAAGQPGGIYGAFKSLKTSTAMDLFLSLAMGHPFLDCFPIPAPVPVAFMSGESAMADLKSIAQRICGARHWSLDRVEGFHLSPMLPRLDDPAHMREIERFITDRGVRAFGVDPAYLCMDLADDAHNLFAVGKFLKPIAELCQSTGCAFLIIHHNKRSVPDPFAPAELSDVAWSGFAEFSAQWLLLSRRSPFDPETGRHAIWLNCGGRAGHCGVYGIDIDEGRFDDEGGRVWKVEVHLASEARAKAVSERARQQDEDRERKQSQTAQKDRQAVLKALKRYRNGETATKVREAAMLSGTRFTPVLVQLEEAGLVEACDIPKTKGTYRGIKLAEAWWDKVGQDGTVPAFPVSEEDGGTRDSYRESQSHPIIFDRGRGSNGRKSVPPSGRPKDWDEF